LLRAQDVYKLIHQGVFGPGHIFASAAGAKRLLKEEMAAMQVRSQKPKVKRQKSEETLIEPIEPGGWLVRVNLRPFVIAAEVRRQNSGVRRQNSGAEWLVEALIESAKRAECDPDRMKRRLAAAVRWCRNNLPRQAAGLERMAARAEESGFPAFHHSPAYARAYRPAYRVILRSCLSPDLGVNHQDTKSQRAG
jgi:hypothetical protein